MKIRLLEPHLINQIAAGEVIERPASVVKELVENSIDAGATEITVTLRDGGRSLIAVKDNGCGMAPDELELAIQRHATSKLPDSDLFNIATLGFRGEALPSIGAVSRLHITSHKRGSAEAWTLKLEGGEKQDLMPAVFPEGTIIEVKDLFYATPARLKFLKAPNTEYNHAVDHIQRLAMAHPEIHFKIVNDQKVSADLKASTDPLTRLGQIMSTEFAENSLPIDCERDGYSIQGYVSLPTLNRATASHQYLFVNDRPVKDKVLIGAVRASFQDFLAKDRHPLLALFLQIPSSEVDMNVHPAKTEVRFREAQKVRNLIVSSIKQALTGAGHRASTTIAQQAVSAFRPSTPSPDRQAYQPSLPLQRSTGSSTLKAQPLYEPAAYQPAQYSQPAQAHTPEFREASPVQSYEVSNLPLGHAKAQVHGTYIVAQTAEGIVIVDQHAAHERLVYEDMKKAMAANTIVRQALLIPEVVELDTTRAQAIAAAQAELQELGLVIEPFGDTSILVRETPAIMGQVDCQGLIKDLADEMVELDKGFSLKEHIDEILATVSCHGSVRSGRKLTVPEMDDLLRQMEATPNSGQCNHGRPTYVELGLADIEKLFGRR
jgi:DNA mismatch repair protein MutL